MYLKVGQKNLEPPTPVSLSFSLALAQHARGPLSLPEVRALRPRLLSVPCILCLCRRLRSSVTITGPHGAGSASWKSSKRHPSSLPPAQTLATPDPVTDLRALPLCWPRTTGVVQSRGSPTASPAQRHASHVPILPRLPSRGLLVTQCSYPTVCTDHSPFTHSAAGGHRGCLRLWGIMSTFLIVVKST